MRGLYGHLLLPSIQALLFMQDFAAGEGASRLKRTTSPPVISSTTVNGHSGDLVLDIYTPREPIRAGMVLIPGVSPKGKDDPRLIRFATTLTRCGFAVVVPDLASLRSLVVLPEHYRDVVAAFKYLRTQPTLCPNGRAGIGGFSFAMGPSLLAALEPTIRDDVRFLFCIGGYHNIHSTLQFVTSGQHRLGDTPWQKLDPDHYGRWVLASSLIHHIPDEASRAAVREIVERRLPDVDAPIDALEQRVTHADGQRLLAFVKNKDRERKDELFAQLPTPMREALLALDLSNRDLKDLKARLILVHGYEDRLIPYTESLGLYSRAGKNHRLYLVHGLGHVTVKKPGLLDGWALTSAVTALLREQQR